MVWLGRSTIRWQGPTRGWTAIGLRLAGIWVLVLLIGGARWERRNRDLEVIVLRDVSASTASVPHPGKNNICDLEEDYLKSVATRKPASDRLGVVSFDDHARIDLLPADRWRANVHHAITSTRDDGTDIASAIQLGLASFRRDAMRRMVLMSDGNATQGDTAAALEAAAGAGGVIDVVPLAYRINNDVMIERLIAPAVKREGEKLTLEAVIRSTRDRPVCGSIWLSDCGMRVDLDPTTPGVQASVPFCVSGTVSHVSIKLPPLKSGMHRFEAALMLDGVGDETSNLNNSAEALTVVRGRTRVLYVESGGGSDASLLPDALVRADIEVENVDRISPEFFPRDVSQLQGYDAIVLANVQRGVEGLNLDQERALVRYVRDLGGGLVVVGGPHALGAGQWEGSELESVLPVDMRPAQRHSTAPGALVIVVDRSGSMGDALAGGESKLQAVNAAAMRAMELLSPRDRVGVIAFNESPQWTIPLTQKRKCNDASLRLAATSPQGGTAIGPALEAAYDALARLSPDDEGVRHVLLMTDGVSEPADYDAILSKMTAAKITLSTVAVGGDADCILLGQLARHGGGFAYNAGDANHLCDAFVHDAALLRWPMIVESAEGIAVVADARSGGITGVQGLRLGGMVLSSVKPAANVEVLLRAAGPDGDPVLTRLAMRSRADGCLRRRRDGAVGSRVGEVGGVREILAAVSAIGRARRRKRGFRCANGSRWPAHADYCRSD